MILDATTKSIEIDLGEAHTTAALPIVVDYVDLTTTTTVAGSADTASNGTTTVTIVAAPAASTQRKVNYISVYNADTVQHVTTIQLNNNTTLRSLIVVTLGAGETLQYTDVNGWGLVTTAGVYALINGSASQAFSVATATAAAHAVRSDQLSADNTNFPIYSQGTWTPNQGAGLTVVGAYSSAGYWKKVGNLVTIGGYIQGATSVAITAAGQVFTNAPFNSSPTAIGMLQPNSLAAGGLSLLAGVIFYSQAAIAATPQIHFSCTYQV
ncbi:MAG: hypothetical protein WC859_10145 [Elusimicrobiota bacterium]|jgi:hypothetical protein